MVSAVDFEQGIEKIILEFGQDFMLAEPGQATRHIQGVITTVQNGNAQLVNSADIESIILYTRANVPEPRKFGTITATNGKRYVIQETHSIDVKGSTVVYKSILKA